MRSILLFEQLPPRRYRSFAVWRVGWHDVGIRLRRSAPNIEVQVLVLIVRIGWHIARPTQGW